MLDRWRAVLSPSLVGQHEVDVVLKGAPALRDAAGQVQMDAIANLLIAAVQRTVDVEHRGDAM